MIASTIPNFNDPVVMLVTSELQARVRGGRELLCVLNHEALTDIYRDRLIVLELPRKRLQGFREVIGAFGGHIDGLSSALIAKALAEIQAANISKVFVDGSNLGLIVKAIKMAHPYVEISTFFHNVEARFFLGSFKQSKSLRALAVLMANYLAERKAVRYSDKVICLSERDSRLLQKVYGRAATHLAPMALQDKLPKHFDRFSRASGGKFALFVGGAFYANQAGIAWFVEHVVPRIEIKICIVGRGFEEIHSELEREGKVEVIGAVNHLADWYRDACFVIAPIFDGSGMKTKVAEALMYGKKIVGTSEAFSGYEDIVDRAGWSCATPDDFVDAIAYAQREVVLAFDPQLRALYEEKYSLPAARERLAKILASSGTDA